MSKQYTVIQDPIGRTILGTIVGETDTTLTLNNPVIIHWQPMQDGSIQVQSIPLFVMELISKEKRDKNNWTYNKHNIVRTELELSAETISQYDKINTPQIPEVKTASNVNPKVISINDL